MPEGFFHRYKRYVCYTAEWLFKEKIHGLDFTMRDLSLINETDGVLHGYSKTDESHAESIFEKLNELCPIEKLKLLDVGCGKGVFLRKADMYPFKKISGIEYSEEIARIAKKNFKILGLDDRIKVYHIDAINFDYYSVFNVFYFFNPFEKEIMDRVMGRIVDSVKSKYWVILHNPVSAEIVEKYGGKEKVRLYDKAKSYETIIYELIP